MKNNKFVSILMEKKVDDTNNNNEWWGISFEKRTFVTLLRPAEQLGIAVPHRVADGVIKPRPNNYGQSPRNMLA